MTQIHRDSSGPARVSRVSGFGYQRVVIDLDDSEFDSDMTIEDDNSEAQEHASRSGPSATYRVQPDLDAVAVFGDFQLLGSNLPRLRARKTVELVNGDFLRITSVHQYRRTGNAILRGHLFRRNRHIGNMLEKKKNEVTWLQRYDQSDARDLSTQSIHTVDVSQIVRVRQLFLTNRPYPVGSYRGESNVTHGTDQSISETGRLVCRWKFLSCGAKEGSLITLSEAECTPGYFEDPRNLRHAFRGPTRRGGASSHWLEGEMEFDNAERVRCGHRDPLGFGSGDNITPQRYNLGDGFCGAGGVSRGAKAAGLRVDWGFDFDEAAIRSYSHNFFNARCEVVAAHEFALVINENFKVDILHLSPPCQTFSPYYAIHLARGGGRDHDMNQATFFALEQLLLKCKPRVVTLEETFGLLRNIENTGFFQAMIQMFTKLGFSVRWKIFNLLDYGLPQPRKRLIVFASCPGETLPEFPEPTHCPPNKIHRNPGQKPYTTVNDTIARIPHGLSYHNPEQVVRRNGLPYDANKPLSRTITCTSGAETHPSGTRAFTNREVACLQGFPLEHQFGDTHVRKQIGNAVPPIVMKTFFEQVIRTLRRSDGL